jgi:homoaconitase/3-isopropylmalate dehydratase large subunit
MGTITMTSLDSFRCCKPLKVGSKTYAHYSLPTAEKNGLKGISRLPFSLKVLLENLLRNEDGRSVTKEDIQAVAQWLKTKTSEREIAFRPARVLMQDFTGVPAVVDLAAMRDAMKLLGGDPKKINPLVPVDLVCDHSVAVTFFGTNNAVKKNVEEEYRQNRERYEFLKWSQKSFDDFRVVPPGTGICHQVNLEYLSQTVWSKKDKVKVDGKVTAIDVAYPDTLVGTDSHTTMVNGLAVLGWGVGGIEAEAAMLGQPYSMLLPEVIGVKFTGKLKEGVTATDLVLTVTQMLRKRGVVGKFVEYFGPGLANLSIADRATIGNMSPEYGATCGFFPVDDDTVRYLTDTARPAAQVALVAAYCKAQGLYRTKSTPDPVFTDILKLELSQVEPSLAGPKRPQDRVALRDVKAGFTMAMEKEFNKGGDGGKDTFDLHPALATSVDKNFGKAGGSKRVPVEGREHDLGHGDVVIAAITSCTNTSNPNVMIGAGLLARKAVAKGLTVKPWVKTSLAPGSQVVAEYLDKSGLQKDLDKLGYNLVGFGCTTCIGNSGPLAPEISKTDQRQGSRRRGGAVRQSQFRRPRQRRRARELSGLAAAGRRLCARGVDVFRSPQAAARPRQAGQEGLPQGHLALEPRDQRRRAQDHQQADVRQEIRRRVQGRHELAQHPGEGRLDLRLGQEVDLRAEPAVLRRHGQASGAAHRHRGCARAVPAAGLDHDRPHLAGGLDQAGLARGQVSDRAQGEAGRLQPVRHAPRQPRSDDARHLRQYPAQEPDGAGRRRRASPFTSRHASGCRSSTPPCATRTTRSRW